MEGTGPCRRPSHGRSWRTGWIRFEGGSLRTWVTSCANSHRRSAVQSLSAQPPRCGPFDWSPRVRGLYLETASMSTDRWQVRSRVAAPWECGGLGGPSPDVGARNIGDEALSFIIPRMHHHMMHPASYGDTTIS